MPKGIWKKRKRTPLSKEHKESIKNTVIEVMKDSGIREKISKSQTGENNNNWKGGRKKELGYIYILKHNHPHSNCRGYVFEHRLVAEKCIGRILMKEESIHHINEIKDDNRPVNLYLFPTHGKHRGYHNLKNKPVLKSNLK